MVIDSITQMTILLGVSLDVKTAVMLYTILLDLRSMAGNCRTYEVVTFGTIAYVLSCVLFKFDKPDSVPLY